VQPLIDKAKNAVDGQILTIRDAWDMPVVRVKLRFTTCEPGDIILPHGK